MLTTNIGFCKLGPWGGQKTEFPTCVHERRNELVSEHRTRRFFFNTRQKGMGAPKRLDHGAKGAKGTFRTFHTIN